MVDRDDQHRPRLRRLSPGRLPDPLRAHGAWVYLIVSVLGGSMAVANRAWLPSLLAATAFAGLLVLGSCLAIGAGRSALIRLSAGLPLTFGAPFLALRLGADASFLLISLVAIPPAVVALYFADSRGFLSPPALAFGVAALTAAAPTAATARGASPAQALLLLAILAPFFFWRTWRLAKSLGTGWTPKRLRRRGLIESAWAIGWAASAVALLRLLFPPP